MYFMFIVIWKRLLLPIQKVIAERTDDVVEAILNYFWPADLKSFFLADWKIDLFPGNF